MDALIEYLSQPTTWVSIIVFVFTLGGAYATLKGDIKQLQHRQDDLEENQKAINWVEFEKTLAQIQTDLQRLKDKWK